jgi:hypothetical protein
MSGDADQAAPLDAGPALFGAINLRRATIWVAAVLAACGLLFPWQATLRDFGDLSGAGFIPLVLGLPTVGLACIIGVGGWRQAGSGEAVAPGHRDVLLVLVGVLPGLGPLAGARGGRQVNQREKAAVTRYLRCGANMELFGWHHV